VRVSLSFRHAFSLGVTAATPAGFHGKFIFLVEKNKTIPISIGNLICCSFCFDLARYDSSLKTPGRL
jgi:hypothetical protein